MNKFNWVRSRPRLVVADPHNPKADGLFRVLWVMTFIGGIGRLVSNISLGRPRNPFVAFTAIEIVGAPLFFWWQFKVARLLGKTRNAHFQLN